MIKTNNNNHPIGILGGTFDPIHFGHLRTALELYQNLNLQEVRFIPCKQPVHKSKTYCTAEQRKHMVELAIKDERGLLLDTRELARETPSYMIETLASLRTEFDKQPICLIMGLDALAGINTWHQWKDIIKLAHLIVIDRPEFNFHWQGEIGELLQPKLITDPKKLLQKQAGYILKQTTTLLNISATEIRHLIKSGKSPRYLLPDAVLEYIYQEGIFN